MPDKTRIRKRNNKSVRCCKTCHDVFKEHFKSIIFENPDTIPYYSKYMTFLKNINSGGGNVLSNVLFYGSNGFDHDMFLETLLEVSFGKTYRRLIQIKKGVEYIETQFYYEFDFLKISSEQVQEIIVGIIKHKGVNNKKHYIVLKNIDFIEDMFNFRIILERFFNNAMFICSTYSISKIETPIKSRFFCIRLPLFQNKEIDWIYSTYFEPMGFNRESKLLENRNILKNIFMSDVRKQKPKLLTDEFLTLNYPPISELCTKTQLFFLRNIACDIMKYEVEIVDIVKDLLKTGAIKDKKLVPFLKEAAKIEHQAVLQKETKPYIMFIEHLLLLI
jgi:hypothetical protein